MFDVYQEEILEHYKHPHNKGTLEHPDVFAHGNNPVCGDDITMYVRLQDGKVADVRFDGRGCAISQASASMLTDAVKGRQASEVMAMDVESIKELLHIPLSAVRIKCATLGLKVLQEALAGGNK
ncbi:MAG: SUF system NifU family Fe-S cluster assembly protein [Methanomassiliicoccales archaeon]